MKLAIHGGGIGPAFGIEVELALFGHVEEVDDEHIEGEIAIAIAFSDSEGLFLCWVDGLALDIAVGGLGQDVGHAGELSVAAVDLVGGVAGDDEEGDALADV